jgi:hypothetical protein
MVDKLPRLFRSMLLVIMGDADISGITVKTTEVPPENRQAIHVDILKIPHPFLDHYTTVH